MKAFSCIISILITAAAALAGTIPNGDFEAGMNGWQPVAEGGGEAKVSALQPAAGKNCLLLSGTAGGKVWVVGPELPGKVGDLQQLTFSARSGAPGAVLLMSLVADAGAVSGAHLWEASFADDTWHKISLLIRTPPVAGGGLPRLAFGLARAGSFAIDDIDAQPGQPLALPEVKPTGEMEQTDLLPEGWEPEGTLGARIKELAGNTELLVNVNGIEVGVEPRFTCRRGSREGMVIYAVNRGKVAKQLRLTMAAPQGLEAPAWTVPIKPGSTTRFHMALQSLRIGEYWVKLTAASENDEASLPIMVTCQPQYPAPGVVWRGSVDPEALKLARLAHLDLNVLMAAPDAAAFAPMLAALDGRGQSVIAPLLQSLSPLQYLPAVTRLHAEVQAPFWAAAPDDTECATLSVLSRIVMDLRKAQPQSCYISPPIAVARDWEKDQLLPVNMGQITAERLSGVAVAAVQPPVLPAPCVLQQTTDGKPDVTNGALTALGSQTNLSGLRRLLTERSLRLPLLVGELRARPGSDDRLAALHLARAMTRAIAEGATGMLFEPQAGATNGWGVAPAQAQPGETPVQQVVRMLSCELAGATPLVPLADSPGVGASPDASVCYKPFLRGGEGIVVLWNNTGVPQDVTVEFRFEPVVAHRLIFSYQGEFATRRWDPIMQFSEEAFKRGQPAAYVRLDPLQVQVHSFRLLTPSEAWLRKVEFTQPFTPVEEVEIPGGREQRSWWTDMLRVRKRTGL